MNKLRRAIPADAERIHDLLQECGRAMALNGFNNWSPPAQLARVQADIRDREVYILEDGKTIVAAITLNADGVVNRLAVKPELQNRGIGAHLTKAMEQRAVELGLDKISLDAIATNEALLRFYERAGYEREFEHERDGWRFVRMTKRLRNA